MGDDEIVVQLPMVTPDEGQEVTEVPETVETTGKDYTELLMAIGENQAVQTDSFGAALAVVIFALAMVFGALCMRGLLDWR